MRDKRQLISTEIKFIPRKWRSRAEGCGNKNFPRGNPVRL